MAVNPFFDQREGRPRAFWRLLLQFALYFVGSILLALALVSAVPLLTGSGNEENIAGLSLLLVGAASFTAALASVWVAGRFLDKRPLPEFGLRLDRGWWLDLAFGLLLGALLMSGVFLVELLAGWVSVSGALQASRDASFFPAILVPAAFFVCIGIYEELVSRGYQITNLAEGLNYSGLGARAAVLLAWLLSSAFFGILHAFNPGATVVSTFNIMLAGLLLGTGYVLTGQLAIPIGLHITWNFFQGNVFGFPVSGIRTIGATFVEVKQGGPALFTGGAFGPEAGLLGLGAMVVGGSLIVLYTRLRYGKATLQTSLAEPPAAVREARLP